MKLRLQDVGVCVCVGGGGGRGAWNETFIKVAFVGIRLALDFISLVISHPPIPR